MNAFITPIPLARSHATFTSTTARPFRVARPVQTRVPKMISDPLSTSVLLAENPAALQTVANAFLKLNMPTSLIEWGHPAMMAFMVLGMGMPGAAIGWFGRNNEDKREGVKQKQLHEQIMLAFFLLAFLGGTGGTLSVAMQGYDIFETPHFKSALLVLSSLAANSVIAYSGFSIGNDGSPKARLQSRKFHAYFGAATMAAFLVHGALGLRVLLS